SRQRQLRRDLVIAAVVVGEERARALVGPLHWPPERARRVGEADVLRVDRPLHAERAADVVGEDAHLVGSDAEDVGELQLLRPDALARHCQRPAIAIERAEPRARLHGGDDHAGVSQGKLRYMKRALEGIAYATPEKIEA